LHAHLKSAATIAAILLVVAALGAGCARDNTAPSAAGAPAATATAGVAATDAQPGATSSAGVATPLATTAATNPAPATPDPLPSALSDLDQLLRNLNNSLSGSDAGGE
jgi:hypothetical protein